MQARRKRSSSYMRRKPIVILMLMVLIISTMTGCVKVVKIGEEAALTGNVEFNAGDNVADFWEGLALPELTGKAVDLKEFLTKANGDLNSLADEYGKYSMGNSGELTYTVKGTATVEEVVTDKKAGYMVISLQDYTGGEEIRLQTGTVFKGSAVRDALEFIKFGDYKNQEEYAAVSQSIHSVIQTTVIDGVDIAGLTGKQIEFTGCFTVNKNDMLLITPVVLTVK